MNNKNVKKVIYFITSECIQCGICVDVCPIDDAIEEGENQYIITNACINCGKCKAACPIEAIEGK
ncbi:MAG: 4Fe-4S binding protein [Candidatus Cloacimonetes bacterium]|nr:4Fe-4S binding protein [Candidatus Cloacimonadota bacterium]